MDEQRRIIECDLSKTEAYAKCFKRTSQMGYNITANVRNELIEIEQLNRTTGWWVAVIVGFCLYIVPGVLVLLLWKPKDYCKLLFETSEDGVGTTVIGLMKGEKGSQFFSVISSLLL